MNETVRLGSKLTRLSTTKEVSRSSKPSSAGPSKENAQSTKEQIATFRKKVQKDHENFMKSLNKGAMETFPDET